MEIMTMEATILELRVMLRKVKKDLMLLRGSLLRTKQIILTTLRKREKTKN
jgi:hypothetical protein